MDRRPLLVVWWLTAALAAAGSPAFADWSETEPLARLVSPAAGTEWIAGTPAAVEWEPGSVLSAMPEAEEWEAFLSVDGGETYPLRITPHLDLSVRRFTLEVPHLPTRRARLLLRFGDEKREIELEVPWRFAIVAGPSAAGLPPQIVFHRGESARKRDPGVVVWIEGPRDGRTARQVASAEAAPSLRRIEPVPPFFLPLFWPAPDRASLAPPEAAAFSEVPEARGRLDAADGLAPPAGASVRLLIHRFNE